jgi:hypothetical protein
MLIYDEKLLNDHSESSRSNKAPLQINEKLLGQQVQIEKLKYEN